ncbi:unnamed protein product [Lymnaea stagnalis]|uniref:FH2 domain-containing protein n=1 Tax=Lymnaea stagnalis TaxID=6523 RepID=A0AAV2HQP3_LYMST
MMPGAPPPPPPPPPSGGGLPPPPPPFGLTVPEIVLPQTNTPKPKHKMKSLNWQKIPLTSVIGKANLWTEVGSIKAQMDNKVDYSQLDELFGVTYESSTKRRGDSGDGQAEGKKKKEKTEINILDGKRSLNVNIFLKQFRMSYEEIVQLLREGRREVFGAERLKSLLKQLPSQEEIDALNAFDGDKERLGNPEKFFLILMGLPNYRMRIEGLLVMEEYNANMEWIRPSIEAVIQAARDIQESDTLKELIFLILVSGNYLNSGNYAGNAAGFKISSLLKLTELRANKPGMNLMHYVAQQAAEKKPKLLKFPEEMKFLKDASQVSMESLTTDVTNIASKVKAITEQIVMAGRDFQQQMSIFLKEANIEVRELEEDLEEIEQIRHAMATYLCEDIKTFKLEEFFKVLQTFCDKLKKAHEENIQRRIQEVKEEEKKNKKDADSRRNSRDLSEPTNQMIDRMSSEAKKGTILDELLADVRSGFTSSKLNEGNFSVTKVTKVNLGASELMSVLNSDSNGDDPLLIRGGYGRVSQRRRRGVCDSSLDSPGDGPSPTPDSTTQRRSRNGLGIGDDVSLTDFLMEAEASPAEPLKPETAFERYASLRRRRLERKQKKSSLEVFGSDRERATSPSHATVAGVNEHLQMRPGGGSMSAERPKSDIEQNSKAGTLRRTRSLMDRSGGARRDQSSEDESEALINRLKQKLARKDGRTTPTSSDEAESSKSSNQDSSTPTSRTSSRWRSGITVSETNSPLEPISEKNPTLEDFTTAEQSRAIQKTREKNSNRFRSSLDPTEVSRVLQNIEKSSGEEDIMKSHRSKDDSDMVSPQVSKSVRLKMSDDMGTNIDHLLKTIEDMGRPIDSVGVSGPIRRTAQPATQKSPSQQRAAQPQVAVVAHITASNMPNNTPFNENELKAKREMRKKRANISMDDVKAAMRLDPSSAKTVNVKNNNNNSVSSARTPPSPRRASPKTNKTESDVLKKEIKELSMAAKLAGKKKFRDARFGSSSSSDSKTRARSNVEPDSVDKALKELVNRNNMSRSKSFDEKVDEETLTSGGAMRNSGSAPDTTQDNQADSRSSLDGRLYGSSGQLSLKSANTSTETIPANVESSPEQMRKHSQANINRPRTNSNSQPPRPNSTTPLEIGVSPMRRSYSLLDKSKYFDEESDDPNASIAKWRMRRERQRKSVYDNLLENDSNNEAGSRSSYASSNDKDEGFETGSGTWSQRTSMSSTLEAEIIAAQSRRADGGTSKCDNVAGHVIVSNVSTTGDQSALSGLSEETDRKARTQNWTEQAVRVNTKNGESKDIASDISESSSALSPDSGLSTSKEDFWSEECSQTVSPIKTKNDVKKTPSKDAAAKTTKLKSVPSYMMPTGRSAVRPSSATPEPTFKRDTPSRTSVKERAVTPTLKREMTVRASMRAEASMASFQRGTIARTSVRGPRSSLQVPGTPTSKLEQPSPSGRQRADSNASISSRLSTSSTNKTKATPKPATPCHSAAARATASVRPATASSRATTPTFQRSVTPANNTKTPTTPSQTSSPFSRTQSMRVTSTRASLGANTKHSTPLSDSRRSITPLSHEIKRSTTPLPSDTSRSTTPQLPERPHSTTPASSSNRRSSFMAPTASSKARADEQTPVAPPRAKTLAIKATASPFTRHSSLRLPPRAHELLGGPKSPTTVESSLHHKPDHHQSLSTVTEQAGDEALEERKVTNPKKSPSILHRIGRGSTRMAPGGKTPAKGTNAK